MPNVSPIVPVIFTVFIWWFTTGLIIVIYGRSRHFTRLYFGGATAAMIAAFVGLLITRHDTQPHSIYIAVTCGVVIYGWHLASYYLGFITGIRHPYNTTEKLSLGQRFRIALQSSIYHELSVLACGLILIAFIWQSPNRWGLWMFGALYFMHISAKLNVFLGVRNFKIDFLPAQLHYLDHLLGKKPHNILFPFSIAMASSIALMLVYRGIVPTATIDETIGALLVATMIGLGILEHWLLVIPLPATLWGWGLRPLAETPTYAIKQYPLTLQSELAVYPGNLAPTRIDQQKDHQRLHIMPTMAMPATETRPTTAAQPAQRIKQTHTIKHVSGPLVVDVWQANTPTNNPPILLIHGWGGSGSYWHQTAFALSATTKVIVPDLPGTGRSQPVTTAQNMFDQVETLRYIIDYFELDRIQVVGHSMGSAMALLLTDAEPQRVERLVLTSLSFFVTDMQERIYRGVMQVFKTTLAFRPPWLVLVPGVQHMMATRYFHNVPNNAALLRQGLTDYLELDAKTAIACAENAPHRAIPEAGARVQVPTLLIACRQDRVMPVENVDYTVETIPNCQLRWIEDCGHMPMIEKADEYMAILRGFLQLEQ